MVRYLFDKERVLNPFAVFYLRECVANRLTALTTNNTTSLTPGNDLALKYDASSAEHSVFVYSDVEVVSGKQGICNDLTSSERLATLQLTLPRAANSPNSFQSDGIAAASLLLAV
jgi:hypothetical protein